MQVIHKHALMMQLRPQDVPIPTGGQIIHVATQFEIIHVWFVCTPSNKIEHQKILIAATGQEFHEHAEYLGTVHIDPFVWHILRLPN